MHRGIALGHQDAERRSGKRGQPQTGRCWRGRLLGGQEANRIQVQHSQFAARDHCLPGEGGSAPSQAELDSSQHRHARATGATSTAEMPSVRHDSAARPGSPRTASSTPRNGSTIRRSSRSSTGIRSASNRSSVPAPSGTHGEQALLLPGHSKRRLKLDDPHQEGMRIPVRHVYLVVALPPKRDSDPLFLASSKGNPLRPLVSRARE
jgi:hypothetical protein